MNLLPTPDLAEGVSDAQVMKEFIFDKSNHLKPLDPIPSVKTDLHSIPTDQHCIVWFGHSSYFLQVDGTKFLVDPVSTFRKSITC